MVKQVLYSFQPFFGVKVFKYENLGAADPSRIRMTTLQSLPVELYIEGFAMAAVN